MAKLSVITVNLNNKSGIENTIASVLNQSFTDFEFIIIDGGSTDGSVEVIETHHEKITFFISEKDNGPYHAMNKGIAKATGTYCLFLNSGDCLFNNDVFQNIFNSVHKEDILYGNMMIDCGEGKILPGFMPQQISFYHMFNDTLWHPVSFIKRKLFEKIGTYNENYKIVADYDFFFRAIVMHAVSTKHLQLIISVFKNYNGLSSTIANHQLIKSEKEKVLASYLPKKIIEFAESYKQLQNCQPLISVIIPAYNYGHLISETLKSILSQSYLNWECFVIDNGSTDNTKQIVESYCEADSRIKYFYQSNSGPSVARNFGMSISKGELIQFLDADDLLESEKFKTQIEILIKHPKVDIVYSDMRYFPTANPKQFFYTMQIDQKNNLPWMKKISGSGENLISALIKENIMVINSPLIRKSVFDKAGVFDESLRYNEDWDLWVRCALNNFYFYYHEEENARALVRVHESYSKDKFGMYIYGLKVCLKINSEIKTNELKKIMADKIGYHQNVIDRCIASAAVEKRIEMTQMVFQITNLFRYKIYLQVLKIVPPVVFKMYLKLIYLITNVKRKLIYA